MALTSSNLDTLETLIRVTAGMSLLGVGVIMWDVSKKWTRIRVAPSRIVLWWIVASAIPLPFMLIARSQIPTSRLEAPSALCTVQASFITFGFLASALWAGFMALNIYLAIVRKCAMSTILKAERTYHLIAWGVPFAVAVLPLVASTLFSGRAEPFYGDASLWCWITNSWAAYRFLFFFGPLWVVFIFTLIVYGAVGIEVSRTFNTSESVMSNTASMASAKKHLQARMTFVVKTSLYLLAFFFTYIGATTNRLVSIASGNTYFSLFVFHVLTIPSVGIWAALAYFGGRFVSCFGIRDRAKQPGKSTMDEEWTNDSDSSGGAGSTPAAAGAASNASYAMRPMGGGNMSPLHISTNNAAHRREKPYPTEPLTPTASTWSPRTPTGTSPASATTVSPAPEYTQFPRNTYQSSTNRLSVVAGSPHSQQSWMAAPSPTVPTRGPG